MEAAPAGTGGDLGGLATYATAVTLSVMASTYYSCPKTADFNSTEAISLGRGDRRTRKETQAKQRSHNQRHPAPSHPSTSGGCRNQHAGSSRWASWTRACGNYRG